MADIDKTIAAMRGTDADQADAAPDSPQVTTADKLISAMRAAASAPAGKKAVPTPPASSEVPLTIARGAKLFTRGAAPVATGAMAGGALGMMAGPGAPLAVPAGALLGATAVPLADAGATAYNMAADKFGMSRVGMPSEVVDSLLTRAGLPEPQNATERMIETAGSLFGGAGIPTGATASATKAVGPITSSVMQDMARRSYKIADDAGVVVKPGAFRNFVNTLGGDLSEKGLDDVLTPNASRTVSRLNSEAGQTERVASNADDWQSNFNQIMRDNGFNLNAPTEAVPLPKTLQQLEIMRRVARTGVNKAVVEGNKDDARLAQTAVDHIDDFVNNLKPEHLESGDAAEAVGALRDARNLWRKSVRMGDIEDIVQMAENTGKPQIIQQEFQKILKKGQQYGNYSDAEWKLVKKIGQNGSLDYLSKLAPDLSLTGVAKSATAAAASGYVSPLVGGIVGASQVAGLGARYFAPKMRAANIQRLSDTIGAGGVPRPLPTIPGSTPVLPSAPYIATPLDEERARRAMDRATAQP